MRGNTTHSCYLEASYDVILLLTVFGDTCETQVKEKEYTAMLPILLCCRQVVVRVLVAAVSALTALCLFTLAATPAAQGKPLCPVYMAPDKITVQGPGITGTVAISDTTPLSAGSRRHPQRTGRGNGAHHCPS